MCIIHGISAIYNTFSRVDPPAAQACRSVQHLHRSAQKVRIFADPEMPWTLDGEKEDGHEMVEVENLHHAIRLMQKKDEDA